MRKLIAAILITLSLVAPVNAGNDTSPTTFNLAEKRLFTPVDNETWCGDCVATDYTTGSPWTVNPTQCLWDIDDYFEYNSSGNIMAPGASISFSECHIYAIASRFYTGGVLNYTVWRSSSPDLQIKYTWTWDAGSKSFTLPPPIKSGTQYLYQFCLYAPPPIGGTSVAIPDSHDGTGIYQTQTVTITNPTNKKVGKTGGIVGSDLRDYGLWCGPERPTEV